MVQGSRSAPLCWARVAALLMRLTRSLFAPDVARSLCYVDDPLFLFSGTMKQRRKMTAMCVLTREALGFGLQYKKGQLGSSIEWIGGSIIISSTGVTARIAEAIVQDIQMLIKEFMGKNHAAGLLFSLRPFLHQLYGAMHTSSSHLDSHNGIWLKQIRHSLSWLDAFFSEELLGVVRHFEVSEYLGDGTQLELGTDASPFGLGVWLSKNGVIIKYFHDAVTQADADLFGHKIGSCEGQQTWECLALLVGARLWEDLFSNRRVSPRVRGDNVGMLTLVVKL